MQRTELKNQKIAAWRDCLPSDILAQIPEDYGQVSEESLDVLADDLAAASARRIPEVLLHHGETLSSAGRARRVRVLAWAIPRVWPDAAELMKVLTTVDDAEGGEAGGRGKIAPLFRADAEALGLVAVARVVRAATHRKTVNAVQNGIREFDLSHNMLRTGGI